MNNIGIKATSREQILKIPAHIWLVLKTELTLVTEICPKSAQFQTCLFSHIFTPTFHFFYTDISAISVTFRNSVWACHNLCAGELPCTAFSHFIYWQKCSKSDKVDAEPVVAHHH